MKPFKYILLIAFVFSFIGCKKYDEGPAISLRTAKARVVNDWRGDGYVFSFYTHMRFSKDNTFIIFFGDDYGNVGEKGTWAFNDNKNALILTVTQGNIGQVPEVWTILKLKEKEVVLEYELNNGFLRRVNLIPAN